jgi:Sugar (pentulose and hexulose) kinases
LNYTNEGGINRSVRLLKNIMGLWIIQECKRFWDKTGEVLGFGELVQLAEKEKPFLAFINVDDDTFYTPGNMPSKVAEFCKKTGQKVPDTKGQIVRCVLESLALKYRAAIEGLKDISGSNIDVLHIVGGGCNNKMLCQFTANAIGRDVVAGPIEATAVGNLSSQLISMGEVKNLEEARTLIGNSFPMDYYEPHDADKWDSAYETFLKLC